MIVGAFFFSLMGLGVKVAGRRLPNQEIVLIRGVLTLALTWWMVRRAGVSMRGSRRRVLMLRGLIGFSSLSCVYYGLAHLPLADATVLQYTNPIWTAILAAWLLGERMSRWDAALVAASLTGVVMIARPAVLFGEASLPLDPFAVAVALAGALLSAGSYVTVRELSRTEHPLTIVFYFTLVTVPAAIPGTVAKALWPTPWEWLVLIGIGLTAQGGQVYLTRGLQLEPAGRATATGYLQIVFATVWGIVFFREIPDVWVFGGASIILGSTLALARVHSRSVPPTPVVDEAANVEPP